MSFIPKVYTVESVTNGHPDKVCDQISDAILDACLELDPQSRCAVECLATKGAIVIAGEVTSKADVDFASVARQVYSQIGYEDTPEVIVKIQKQSPDIAQGVDTGGAGDQGIMYGYACDETEDYLPRGIVLSHALARGLQELRESGKIDWLKPDGKAQVTIDSDRVAAVLVSCQHEDLERLNQREVYQHIIHKLIIPLVKEYARKWGRPADYPVPMFVNPTGKFVLGGPAVDTGLTGRKIAVDTYGGLVPHGGGAFSGKDATKVDRSAAYMARREARRIVEQGKAQECLVSVSYAIGIEEPLMLTAKDESGNDLSSELSKELFKPQNIIEELDLRMPVFQDTACYGHFGKDTAWG
jgi:S-adenosylmethionine synthetase